MTGRRASPSSSSTRAGARRWRPGEIGSPPSLASLRWWPTIARGWADLPSTAKTPTPERVVAHAHELMGILDVDPPYILVGHSWGGPLILVYAGQYPDEVVGMVYLDPTEPDLTPYQYLGASNEDEYASRRAASQQAFEQAIAGRNLPAGMEAERQAIVDFRESAPGDRGLPVDPEVPTAIVLSAQESPPPGGPSFRDEAFMGEMLT